MKASKKLAKAVAITPHTARVPKRPTAKGTAKRMEIERWQKEMAAKRVKARKRPTAKGTAKRITTKDVRRRGK